MNGSSRSLAMAAAIFGLWSLRSLPHLILQSRNGGTIAVVFCCWLILLSIGLFVRDESESQRKRGPWIYAGIGIAFLGALADVNAIRHFGAAWILTSALSSPASRWACVAVAATWIPGCERFWSNLGLESFYFRLVPIVAAGLFFVLSARHCSGQRSGT